MSWDLVMGPHMLQRQLEVTDVPSAGESIQNHNHRTTLRILHEQLHMLKVSPRWVTCLLMPFKQEHETKHQH